MSVVDGVDGPSEGGSRTPGVNFKPSVITSVLMKVRGGEGLPWGGSRTPEVATPATKEEVNRKIQERKWRVMHW